MKAYRITLTYRSNTGSTMDILVIANNAGAAEDKAMAAVSDWGYSFDYCAKIERIAGEGQYEKPMPLLLA